MNFKATIDVCYHHPMMLDFPIQQLNIRSHSGNEHMKRGCVEIIKNLGEFEFFEGYFIGRIFEGANAGSDFVDALSTLIQKHSPGKPIVYISDRVHSYSLDPVATMDLIERNQIRYAAVVTYTSHQNRIFNYEVRSIKGAELRSFPNLAEAVSWAKSVSSKLILVTRVDNYRG